MNSNYDSLIQLMAQKYNVNPTLVKSVMKEESAGDPKAVSKTGAQGLMQLMPKTAQMLGVQNSFDPAQNIEGGTKYLSQLGQQFGGNPALMVAAYNAGPGNVRKYGGIPPFAETQRYESRVMNDMGDPKMAMNTNYSPPAGIPAPISDPSLQPNMMNNSAIMALLNLNPAAAKRQRMGNILDAGLTGLGAAVASLNPKSGATQEENLLQGLNQRVENRAQQKEATVRDLIAMQSLAQQNLPPEAKLYQLYGQGEPFGQFNLSLHPESAIALQNYQMMAPIMQRILGQMGQPGGGGGGLGNAGGLGGAAGGGLGGGKPLPKLNQPSGGSPQPGVQAGGPTKPTFKLSFGKPIQA